MLNEIDALGAALEESREYTLSIYGHLDGAQRRVPKLEIVNPPLWELAHIAYFQEFFVRRWRPDDPNGERTPSRLAGADRLFDSRSVPHDDRWDLDYPPYPRVLAYLRSTLDETLEDLATSAPDDRFRFRLALFHEDMHGEALLMTLDTLGLPAPGRPHRPPSTAGSSPPRDIRFEGGMFLQGARPGDREHAFDNEKWAHEVRVGSFAIASRPVSNGEFLAFVEEGGYGRQEWWDEPGLRWLEGTGLRQPRHWVREGASWGMRWCGELRPLEAGDFVYHVGRHEAEAYCRWAGRRLPTESEWEFAATNGGRADRYPWGDAPPPNEVSLDFRDDGPGRGGARQAAGRTGLDSMIGGVWEWTASTFAPYPGFEKDAYAEYSEPWFHSHAVLRGGCFATRSRLVHNRWRNFYKPYRNDVFAGFRTCALSGGNRVR